MDALKVMSEGGFRHVPVIGNGKLLGVISRGDLKGMEIEEHRWHKHGSRHGIETHRQMADLVKGQRPLDCHGPKSSMTLGPAMATQRLRSGHTGTQSPSHRGERPLWSSRSGGYWAIVVRNAHRGNGIDISSPSGDRMPPGWRPGDRLVCTPGPSYCQPRISRPQNVHVHRPLTFECVGCM